MLPEAFFNSMTRLHALAGFPSVLVCGLSGGMDSVVLLDLVKRWSGAMDMPPRIIAGHINHCLRGEEADRDEDFCRLYAAGLGVEFHSRKVDVAAVAKNERLGIEEAGRDVRYRFFAEISKSDKPFVLTGHHADDQAETILLNLKRGAHRRGLCGMRDLAVINLPPDVTICILRPLLLVPRDVIQDYAERHSLVWREDVTNADVRYTRNRIRHRIIPALEAIVPGFRDRLLEKSRRYLREEERMVAAAKALVKNNATKENAGRFFRLDDNAFSVRERLFYAVRYVLEEEMGRRLPYGAVLSRVLQLAESGKTGESLSLPGRLQVIREKDGLFFFYPDAMEQERLADEIMLPDPPFNIQVAGLEIAAEWLPVSGKPPGDDMLDPEVEWFNPVAIKWPLILRHPYPGEKIRLLGSPGRRKIQDILVDKKIPRRKRNETLILADHAGAVWLWPYRLAHRVRLEGDLVKALRISIKAINNG
jgi:tRNA(Ile)-lysidine synthetase, N-terminal domain/tRNA(Ile)-lysidine synthetase, C-terminal domain